MIDRQTLITEALDRLDWQGEGTDLDKVERIVDEVLIPELAKHEDQNLQLRIAAAVDACGQSYQAAIKRQRDSITRLLEERKALKNQIDTLEDQVRAAR
jgi:hypothetical protein